MTGSELAILSLVVEKPRYGYELEQVIEERGMREWSEIGFSSIYYLLKKLEDKKLVTGRLQRKSGGPARKVYKATDRGRAALYHGALQSFQAPVNTPKPLLLGLSVLPMLNQQQVIDRARQYLEALRRRRSELAAKRDGQDPPLPHVTMMFDYSLTLIDAEIGWVASLIKAYEITTAAQSGSGLAVDPNLPE